MCDGAAETTDRPLPYVVRHSSRARHARITVTPHNGIVVVLPVGSDIDVAAVVEQRRSWIEQAIAEFAHQSTAWTAEPASLLPSDVSFRATGETWPIEYRSIDSSVTKAMTRPGRIVVSGDLTEPEQVLKAIQRWLHNRARERLIPMLHCESDRTGLVPERVTVRGQRDRWAGCSPSGHITLNRLLLFLDEDLVRSVMCHELAHLSHPDHSPRFWATLRELDRDADRQARRLAAARDSIPAWAEPRRQG